MLRLSPLLLVLAAGAAIAQEAPPPATQPTTPAETSPTTTTPAPATATTTAPTAATQSSNPRLAPGGVVAGGKGFPLHLQATLDTSLGNGILAPGYQAQPSFGSSLNLRPSASLPKLDGLPRVLVNGSIDFSVNSWTSSFQGAGTPYERMVRVGDPSLALILPGLYTEEFTGISMSIIASARAPLSITSRQQNLVTSIGAAAQFAWSSPDTPVGSFFVQYTPSVRGNLYSQLGATMPCEASNGGQRPIGDPINGVDQLPTFIPARDAQILPDGSCILPGRQTLASVGNSVATGWSDSSGNHNVSLSLGISHAFARPLKSDPALSSLFSSGQNFNESTSGSLSYTYQLPLDFNVFITTGLFSGQPAFAPTGYFNFPFWDFVTPANNNSGVFFDVTVGI